LKLSYSDDDLWWNRAHPEVPTLVSGDGTTLPGSPAFYAYKNLNRTTQGIYSTVWTRNRHIISAGAGVLFRFNSGYLTAGQGGEYLFPTSFYFAEDDPQSLYVAIDRTALQTSSTPVQPDYNRTYSYPQMYLFAQDSYRVSSRLTLNYGIRYDNFGAPANTGPAAEKDTLLQLGSGTDFTARLASATLVQPASGNEKIYGADNGDWAGRFGFSWDPFGKSKTVLRGGYGMFYDAPFDNLWQNVRSNDVGLAYYQLPPGAAFNYLAPMSSVLSGFANQSPNLTSSEIPITLMDPKLRNGYAQDSFLGVQQSIGDSLTFEINGTAALGRRLITTDIVNREYTTTDTAAQGRPNGSLPDVAWRSSQGNSDYTALSAIAKYKWRTLFFQAAYTWSHAIDDQSDPLNGDFFNLDFTAITNASSTALRSSFAEQYNSSGDRGNSDFDQRQNLFLLGIWRCDGRRLLTRGWRVSWMAAFRTGFPYTVTSPIPNSAYGASEVETQRADLTNPAGAILANPVAGSGGVYLSNPSAFSVPQVPGVVGNTGRNEFTGPGLYNLDFSLGRSFAVPRLREGTRITIRADAFNILNHANLNNPNSLVGSADFGLATYGRQGTASGFPAVSPVNETARQVQMLLRLEF
jgi:hypothetical protein